MVTPAQILQSRRITRQFIHGRATALYDQKYHPMDEITRPKSALKHRERSVHAISESQVDKTTPPLPETEDDGCKDQNKNKMPRKFQEGIRRSKRNTSHKRPFYDTQRHPQDELLALAGIRRTISRRHKKPKVQNDQESKSTQSTIRVPLSDGMLDSSSEEVIVHSALGVHGVNDEMVVTASGEDSDVSSVLSECGHPTRDDQTPPQCIEPSTLSSLIGESEMTTTLSDTYTTHGQEDTYFDHFDGVGSIDTAMEVVEEQQKSSYATEETATQDYDIFFKDNERTPKTSRLSQVSGFTFPSEYSCG